MKKIITFALAAVMLLGLLAGCGGGGSAAYPNKDVQIIVPYAPGGGSDNLVRGMMQYLDLGATTVAVNVDGAAMWELFRASTARTTATPS